MSLLWFDSPSFGELFLWWQYNSPPIHPFGELFLCRPSLGWAIFVPTIYFSILWRVIFRANHLTLHPSIPLVSYLCTAQPLGKLFLCLLFDSGELFLCWPFNSLSFHPFGELFCAVYLTSIHPYVWWVIFVICIGMMSNILLQLHLRFIWAPIVMYRMIVETEESQNSSL